MIQFIYEQLNINILRYYIKNVLFNLIGLILLKAFHSSYWWDSYLWLKNLLHNVHHAHFDRSDGHDGDDAHDGGGDGDDDDAHYFPHSPP